MPWKNGGGETAEIAISPPGAPLDRFDWRVSMARVEVDGPFSVFDGVDRTLAILEGAGVRLRIGDAAPTDVTTSSAPYAFAADVTTSATLIAGPITDLNVMTRRGRASHRVRRQDLADSVRLEAHGAAMLVVCESGCIRAVAPGVTHQLEPKDTLVIAPGDAPILITSERQGSAFIIELDSG